MCNSGFYRIPGSNVCFPLVFFFLFTTDLLIVFLSRKSLLFLCFSLFFAALSSQPTPSIYNGVLVFPGNRWFPCFTFLRIGHVLYLSLGKSHFRFFSFFPSFSSDSFESSWLAIFFGMCWGMPFSASPFLAVSTFPFSFPSGRNPVLPTWKPLVIILFFVLPCSGSPRFFLSVPWEVAGFYWRSRSFCFCFLFSSSVFFLSSCPSLPLSLCLKGYAPLDGPWGSLLLIPYRGSLF